MQIQEDNPGFFTCNASHSENRKVDDILCKYRETILVSELVTPASLIAGSFRRMNICKRYHCVLFSNRRSLVKLRIFYSVI